MRLSDLNLSMLCPIFHVILLCCMSFLYFNFPSTVMSIRRGNETDRLALLDLKSKITHDPLQILSSWNETTHFCQWHGVTCGSKHQRVTILDLESQKLEGSISPFIGNLSFLWGLGLDNNSFSHEIPPEIGRLRRLQVLYLNNNNITGEIPTNISGCSDLVRLDFGYNSLVGNVPVELGFLKNLRSIIVQENYLSGVVPTTLGNLSSLEEIGAVNNNIGGTIPNDLGQLMYLRAIALGLNRLSGTIPPSIFNITSLEEFDIVRCGQVTGTIPSDIGITLPNLKFMGFGHNKFTGLFPISMSNASNLEIIELEKNHLIGKVPNLDKLHNLRLLSLSQNQLGRGKVDDLSFLSSLNNTSMLKILSLAANNFGGDFPKSIGNLSSTLERLIINSNQIYGSIPIGISNLFNLARIDLWGNQLTGNIPPEFGKLQKLVEVDLSENKFSGKIPFSLGNLSLLNILDLSKNNFQGNIPSILEQCQNFFFLDLSHNNLSGTIPRQVISISSLSYLDLSKNHFEGPLPIEVGILKNLAGLDVSGNALSSDIPSTLGSCVTLEVLYLEGNFFQGSIPSSFSSLRGVQVLDLSRNNLSGEIPEFLEGFYFLQTLNLSYNDFEGVVPTKGVFKNASAISVVGNNKLCGGIPELLQPKCKSIGSKKRRSTRTLTLIISIICGLVGLLLISCLLYLFWFKRIKKEGPSDLPKNSLLKMSYQSLLKATDGFSSANLIGVGSFGSVYKGVLENDGTIIAVKVLNLLRRGAAKSFVAECETLRNIRHRNLVKILTACSGVDYKGNDFKALVYEFMANSSLEEWLHPKEDSELASQKLNFLQRINIAIDVASALDYLHHYCETPIVHCDLKPSNVLLDTEMTGHVSDFGLAKFVYESSHDLFTSPTSSIGVRGSVGYTAPEYGMGSEVSISGDVYSYGVLLLEMFTGKRPTDEIFKDGISIHRFVQAALPDRTVEVADLTLVQEIEEEQISPRSHKIRECLVLIFGIGLACSAESARERMNIKDVVAELISIKYLLKTG